MTRVGLKERLQIFVLFGFFSYVKCILGARYAESFLPFSVVDSHKLVLPPLFNFNSSTHYRRVKPVRSIEPEEEEVLGGRREQTHWWDRRPSKTLTLGNKPLHWGFRLQNVTVRRKKGKYSPFWVISLSKKVTAFNMMVGLNLTSTSMFLKPKFI